MKVNGHWTSLSVLVHLQNILIWNKGASSPLGLFYYIMWNDDDDDKNITKRILPFVFPTNNSYLMPLSAGMV